jgi:hypothetical protein
MRTIRAKQEPLGELIADRSSEIRTNSGGILRMPSRLYDLEVALDDTDHNW